jgi:hypothetical protein
MPLTPPGTYRKTRGIIRRGLSSDRPSATDVLEGTLYYASDDRETWRSNSVTWDEFALPPRGSAIDAYIPDGTTGTQDDWDPAGMEPCTIIDWSGVGDIFISGIESLTRQKVIFINTGSSIAYFNHDDAASSAANRFHNVFTIAPTPVAARGHVAYVNNLNGWQMSSHEQGDVIGYVPTWTGAGSNPAIGNGTLGGFYKVQGRWVKGNVTVVAGTTTTFGTGTWAFGYPFTISAGLLGVAYATLGGLTYMGVVTTPSVTTLNVAIAASGILWDANNPAVWANTDAGVVMWDAQ